MCEGQCICPPTHIWWRCNAWSIQRWSIRFYRNWTHKKLYFVVWVAPRLVWFLLWCTRPACHMPMLWRRSDGRESNCVHFLEEQDFLFSQVEASRVGGWCLVSNLGSPGTWILLVLMRWIHVAMDFSDFSHLYIVRWISCINFWTRKIDFPLVNFLCCLTQPEITRQRYIRLWNVLVALTFFKIMSTNHNLINNNFRKTLWTIFEMSFFTKMVLSVPLSEYYCKKLL